MSRLEDELRNALRRQEPPADFADRVMRSVAAQPPPRRREGLLAMLRWKPMRWVAAAAMALVVVGGIQHHREQQARIQGELAKERLLLALRITGSKLQIAREGIQRIK